MFKKENLQFTLKKKKNLFKLICEFLKFSTIADFHANSFTSLQYATDETTYTTVKKNSPKVNLRNLIKQTMNVIIF